MVQSTLTLVPRCSVPPGAGHPHQRSLRGLPPEFMVGGRATATPPATATGPKDYDIRRARALCLLAALTSPPAREEIELAKQARPEGCSMPIRRPPAQDTWPFSTYYCYYYY